MFAIVICLVLLICLCAVPCELSGGGPHLSWHHNSRAMAQIQTLHSRHHSTVLPRLGASKQESLQNLHTRAVDSTIQLLGNNNTEGPPTPNSGRGAETEPETTIQSLTGTIRILPHTVGLPAQGVRRTAHSTVLSPMDL